MNFTNNIFKKVPTNEQKAGVVKNTIISSIFGISSSGPNQPQFSSFADKFAAPAHPDNKNTEFSQEDYYDELYKIEIEKLQKTNDHLKKKINYWQCKKSQNKSSTNDIFHSDSNQGQNAEEKSQVNNYAMQLQKEKKYLQQKINSYKPNQTQKKSTNKNISYSDSNQDYIFEQKSYTNSYQELKTDYIKLKNKEQSSKPASDNAQKSNLYQKLQNLDNNLEPYQKENHLLKLHMKQIIQNKQKPNMDLYDKNLMLQFLNICENLKTKNVSSKQQKKQVQSYQFDISSSHDSYQQESELSNQSLQGNCVDLLDDPVKNVNDGINQYEFQLTQTTSTIQEVKIQKETDNKEKPSHKSSNSSCYSSSQKSQKQIHTKDLINVEEKPTTKTTFTMFKENQQIPPKIQQKPMSTVFVHTQTVVVNSQKVESQKVEGQKMEGQLKEKSQQVNQKQAYEEVESLRQRVKQLQQLNKQYLSIIENLSFTVKNMSLLPQQLNKNSKAIEITEKKEKEQPNLSKKSFKQQIFQQEEY